jgi:hypothetical protein
MGTDTEPEGEAVEASRRVLMKALASAPVILTLVPGRARAEYAPDGEYFNVGSIVCLAPPDVNPGGETGEKDLECQQWGSPDDLPGG